METGRVRRMEAMQIHASPWGECERPAVEVCLVVWAEDAAGGKTSGTWSSDTWPRHAGRHPIRQHQWVTISTRVAERAEGDVYDLDP